MCSLCSWKKIRLKKMTEHLSQHLCITYHHIMGTKNFIKSDLNVHIPVLFYETFSNSSRIESVLSGKISWSHRVLGMNSNLILKGIWPHCSSSWLKVRYPRRKREKKTEEEGGKSLQCVTTKSFLAISISARFSARFGHQHDPKRGY